MASSTADIELTRPERTERLATAQRSALGTNNSSSGSLEGNERSALLPTDHGKAAWLVLAGCSVIQAPVWGAQWDGEAASEPSRLIFPRLFAIFWGLSGILHER